MRHLSKWRKQQLAVLFVLLVATVTAGIGWAAIPAADGTYTACVSAPAQSGPFRGVAAVGVLDTAIRTTCPSAANKVTWNQTGPQGAQGPEGPQGPQGLQGPQGPAGESGSAQVFFASGSGTASPRGPTGEGGPFFLSTPGVPAGNYVAEAQISAYDYPAHLNCSLEGTNRTLKLFRDPAAPLGLDTTIFGSLVMTSAFTLAFDSAGGVTLSCTMLGAPPGAVTNLDANLLVTKVASVG